MVDKTDMTGGQSLTDADDPIFGGRRDEFVTMLDDFMGRVLAIRARLKAERGEDPVEHCLGRVKSAASLHEKCRRKDLPETCEAAFEHVRDIIGIRVVCAFLNDVYLMRDSISELPGVEVACEKDYIRHVKPNGYRSLHLVLLVDGRTYIEVQIRTISQDTWAALEHQMKYKHEVAGDASLITAELKRCADELASTDISMQTIRDMIRGTIPRDVVAVREDGQ